MLLKASQGQNFTSEFEHACSFYRDDFDSNVLHAQLKIFNNECQRQQKDTGIAFKPVLDIKSFFSTLMDSQNHYSLKSVKYVVKLILIMPASNATSERSFSALRRVKSYLRSTMGQQD